jgi:hypothetical protein
MGLIWNNYSYLEFFLLLSWMQVVLNACEMYLCVKIGGDQFLDN